MILAAHQPCFVPWLGYFHKIAHADCFVVLDHVQYEKQNYQNRNRMKLPNGVGWVTVPVENRALDERICDKRVTYDGAGDWPRRLWRTIEQAYARAPWFNHYAPALRDALEPRWNLLVDLDLHLLELCLDWLSIRTPRILSSSLGLTEKKSELIAELCARTGANVYLAGAGGSRDYLDVPMLAARGVEVRWQAFTHPTYPQQHGAFASHLSVLDLLFNCGPDSRAILLGTAPADERVVAS